MALDFTAGCVGGCAGLVVGHPFDTIKVRLQTDDMKNPRYKGATHCMMDIVKKEGPTGLYKGLASPMLGVAAINGLIFGSYGLIHKQFSDPDAISSYMLAGSFSGLIQSVISCPMELVKTRLQVQGDGPGVKYASSWDVVKQIKRTEGIRGIYRGYGITACRDSMGFGIYFATYEIFTQKVFADPNNPQAPLTTSQMLMAGGLSGMASWLPTYPVDMLKSRLQVDGMVGDARYNGILDCVIKSYKEDGRRAFFRGLAPTMIRAYPVNAVTFAVVSWMTQTFDNDEAISDVSISSEAAQPVLVQEIPKPKPPLKKRSSMLEMFDGAETFKWRPQPIMLLVSDITDPKSLLGLNTVGCPAIDPEMEKVGPGMTSPSDDILKLQSRRNMESINMVSVEGVPICRIAVSPGVNNVKQGDKEKVGDNTILENKNHGIPQRVREKEGNDSAESKKGGINFSETMTHFTEKITHRMFHFDIHIFHI